MEAKEVQNVCRLCPANAREETLLHVFDEHFGKKNLSEIIFLTTGIKILQYEPISKRLCGHCYNIILNMYKFRCAAEEHNRKLKEHCHQVIKENGYSLVTNKKSKIPEESNNSILRNSHKDVPTHPSVLQLYQHYPNLMLPRMCITENLDPIIHLLKDDVENYFNCRKLNMKNFIYKAKPKNKSSNKKPTSAKSVTPIKINKRILIDGKSGNILEKYECSNSAKKSNKRRRTDSSASSADSRSKTLNIDNPLEITEMKRNDVKREATKKTKPDQPEFLGLMGLAPTVFPNIESQSVLPSNANQNIYVIDNKAKDSSGTQSLSCKFCKRIFRSCEVKESHIKNNLCEIKRIIDSEYPYVAVEKVDLDPSTRQNFPTAFSNYDGILPSPVDEDVETLHIVEVADSVDNSDIIILDEDIEEVGTGGTSISSAEFQIKDVTSLADEESNNTNILKDALTHEIAKPTMTAVVKPDMQIKNNLLFVLCMNDSINDYAVVKKAIKYGKFYKLPIEKVIQTDVPGNKDIEFDYEEKYFILKLLNYYLQIYKIAVTVSNGLYSVNYQHKAQKVNNIKSLWSEPGVEKRTRGSSNLTSSSFTTTDSTQTLNQCTPPRILNNQFIVSMPPVMMQEKLTLVRKSIEKMQQNNFAKTSPTIPFNGSINTPKTHKYIQAANNHIFAEPTYNNRTNSVPTRNNIGISEASHTVPVLFKCPTPASTPRKTENRPQTETRNIPVSTSPCSGLIRISESDIVSKKICRKCYESTQNINNIRQIALQQDQRLKDKCKEYLHDKGIKLPNSCIIIRKSNADTADQVLRESDGNSCSIIDKNFSVESKQNPMKKRSIKGVTHLHPSVINLYRKYPKYKLTKKCLDKDITPVVTLCMGQVESYYKRQKLNMNDFIYNPEKSAHKLTSIIRNVARKKTTVPSKSIAQLKLLRTSHKPPSHIVSIKQTTLGKNLPMYSAIPITSVVEKDPDNSAGTSASSVESQKLTLLLKRSHKNRMDDDDEALMSIDEGLNITDNSDTNSKVIVEQEMEGISSNSDGALNANKPNFIQSLGLTPAMLAAGCSSAPVSFDCTICKSTHPNEAALQKHHSRHRICPYCRLKFRTVEIKNNHIENNCAMVGKPGLIAEDKSTEEGKKKSKESPSVDDGTQDSTIISSDKISNTLNKENVIILTDDEDSQATTDDIMEIDVINNTTNIESELHTIPKISICNNVILDQVQNNLTETVFMKKLLLILKKQNLVESREVQACRVNEEKTFAIQDRTCRFTNFSHNFYSYMVPMRFKHGEFTVSFDQTKNLAITTNQWKDISAIVDERKPLSQTQEVSLVNATYPITLVNSQVPSSDQLSLSSSIQVIAAPTMSILLPNTSSAFLGLNVTHDQNQSMQTTPLLQNYTLSMTPLPIINNSVISVQAASNINTDEVVDEKTSSGSENAGSSSSSVSSDGPSTSTSSRSSSTTRKYAAGSSRNLERSTIRRKRRFTSFKAGARKIRSSRSSKLRVKNIWELK